MPKARMFQISISPEEISALELASFPGEIVIVDEAEGPVMEKAVRYLKGQRLLGFDTETRPTFSPEQRSTGTALLQLSSGTKAFLFRLKKCGLPRPLASVLANPNILKIGAATLDDVRGLQKITKFAPKGFVDLQNIVWEYGIRDKSVKKMAAIILGVKISKAQQLSNWEADKLSEGQQRYAATDAWACLRIYHRLTGGSFDPELSPYKHEITDEET